MNDKIEYFHQKYEKTVGINPTSLPEIYRKYAFLSYLWNSSKGDWFKDIPRFDNDQMEILEYITNKEVTDKKKHLVERYMSNEIRSFANEILDYLRIISTPRGKKIFRFLMNNK